MLNTSCRTHESRGTLERTSAPENDNAVEDTRPWTRATLTLGATLATLCDAPELAGESCPAPAGALDALSSLAWRAVMSDVNTALLSGRFRVARLLSDATWTMAHCARFRAQGDITGADWALARARSLAAEIEALESGNAVSGESCREPVLGRELGRAA